MRGAQSKRRRVAPCRLRVPLLTWAAGGDRRCAKTAPAGDTATTSRSAPAKRRYLGLTLREMYDILNAGRGLAAEWMGANRWPGIGWCVPVEALRRLKKGGIGREVCPCCYERIDIPQPVTVFERACRSCESVWEITCRTTEAKARWARMA